MRLLVLASLTLALFASGCTDDDTGGNDDDTPILPPPSNNTTVPAPLHFENSVPVGADPFNVVPAGTPVGGVNPCSSPASTCFYHEFTVEGNQSLDLQARLAWDLPANDFDLYLYQGNTQVSQDGINMLGTVEVPPTTQVLNHAGLAPGTYSFWVAAWNSVGDAYTLDVTFS